MYLIRNEEALPFNYVFLKTAYLQLVIESRRNANL
jgi:hypothetical protein